MIDAESHLESLGFVAPAVKAREIARQRLTALRRGEQIMHDEPALGIELGHLLAAETAETVGEDTLHREPLAAKQGDCAAGIVAADLDPIGEELRGHDIFREAFAVPGGIIGRVVARREMMGIFVEEDFLAAEPWAIAANREDRGAADPGLIETEHGGRDVRHLAQFLVGADQIDLERVRRRRCGRPCQRPQEMVIVLKLLDRSPQAVFPAVAIDDEIGGAGFKPFRLGGARHQPCEGEQTYQ